MYHKKKIFIFLNLTILQHHCKHYKKNLSHKHFFIVMNFKYVIIM
jgi:hypothetical protein